MGTTMGELIWYAKQTLREQDRVQKRLNELVEIGSPGAEAGVSGGDPSDPTSRVAQRRSNLVQRWLRCEAALDMARKIVPHERAARTMTCGELSRFYRVSPRTAQRWRRGCKTAH